MLIVTGSVTARADTFEALLEAALAHVARSRTEPGCLSHSVHVDCENPMRLFFYEEWQDRTALGAHFAEPGVGGVHGHRAGAGANQHAGADIASRRKILAQSAVGLAPSKSRSSLPDLVG